MYIYLVSVNLNHIIGTSSLNQENKMMKACSQVVPVLCDTLTEGLCEAVYSIQHTFKALRNLFLEIK